jgi:hypothetical protein
MSGFPPGSAGDLPAVRPLPGWEVPWRLLILRRLFPFVEVLFDDAASVFGLGLAHEDFGAGEIGGRLAEGKGIGAREGGRSDTGAFEQAANHHRLGPGFGPVDHNRLFTTPFGPHLWPPSSPPIIIGMDPGKTEQSTGHPTAQEIDEESRRVRRLRIVVQLALEIISQGDLPAEEAANLVSATRRVALEMFPGKEEAFDLIYRPKFARLMQEIYRIQ